MKIKRKIFRVLIRIVIVLINLVLLGVAVFLGLQISGRSRLYGMYGGVKRWIVAKGMLIYSKPAASC